MRCFLAAVMLTAACGELHAADTDRKANVKKAAEALTEAMRKKDAAGMVDRTYEAVITEAGGREAMIGLINEGFQMFKFLESNLGEPGEFHVGGKQTFVVIPISALIQFDDFKTRGKSYLLGISGDDGATWKFVDGAGPADEDELKKFLPNLPESLKLPAPEEPEIIDAIICFK